MEAHQNIEEVYSYVKGKLSLSDRLKLIALILKDLTQPSIEVVDQSEHWTEQDQLEISTASLSYAAEIYPELEELI